NVFRSVLFDAANQVICNSFIEPLGNDFCGFLGVEGSDNQRNHGLSGHSLTSQNSAGHPLAKFIEGSSAECAFELAEVNQFGHETFFGAEVLDDERRANARIAGNFLQRHASQRLAREVPSCSRDDALAGGLGAPLEIGRIELTHAEESKTMK